MEASQRLNSDLSISFQVISPTSNVAFVNTTFDFEAYVSGYEIPYDFTWDFGDGSTSSSKESKQTSHKYTIPGKYPVTVTIKDGNGVQGSSDKQIMIIRPIY